HPPPPSFPPRRSSDLGSAFHDGTGMTAVDLLYAYMFAYRWSAPDSSTYDPYVDAATELMRSRLLGLKVVGTDTTAKSFRFDVRKIRRPHVSTPLTDQP